MIEAQIATWEQNGKIERASAGCVVNNPLLCVPKMEGGRPVPDKGRVCTDVRRVNEALETDDRFPILNIAKNHQFLAGNSLFGEIDIEECFLQFKLHVDCRHLTAFTWGGTQWQFVGCPYGVYFFPNWVHRYVIHRVAQPNDFAVTFIDNAAFGANTWEEQGDQLIKLLDTCTNLNLRVKTQAIKVGYTRIRILGHIVAKDGVHLDPRKLDAITHWPRPSTGKEMQSFLGTVGFVRGYIRHYADISAPLEAVKLVRGTIEWTPIMVTHFDLLKKAVLRAPFLKFPDFNRPFYLATDASQLGIGGVLYQPKEGTDDIAPDNIVAIASRILNEGQQRYSTFKKELLGVIFCLRQFHTYLWGRLDTVVYTDHKPLTYMFTAPNPSVTLQNWMDILLDYSFEIRYRPGMTNVLPDHLSRVLTRRYGDSTQPWGVPLNITFKLSPEELVAGEGSGTATIIPSDVIAGNSNSGNNNSGNSNTIQQRAVRRSQRANPQQQQPQQQDIPEEASWLTEDMIHKLVERGKQAPPPSKRIELINEAHAAGHFGRDQVFRQIYDKGYWWPDMRKQIQTALMTCDSCSRFVVRKEGFKPAEYITADGPWHHVQIDTQTNLPRSPEGYTVLLSIVDVFSSFTLLFPLQSKTAEAVAQKLWYAMCLFGFPRIIQSDNGTEFVNSVVKEVITMAGIDHRLIAAWNPRCDGKVERRFGIYNEIAKKMMQGADKYWPQFVNGIQLYMNNALSSLTKTSSFALMFAREANMPSHIQGQAVPGGVPHPIRSLEDWQAYQQRVLSVIYPSIAHRILNQKQQMVSKLNSNRRIVPPDEFKVGSQVMIKDVTFMTNRQNAGKRAVKYNGPYTIVRQDRSGNYVLKDTDDKELPRHVPVDQIKHKDDQSINNPDADYDIYEVENILDHRGEPQHFEYRVKWKGYPIDEASWEPAHSFLDTQCIRDYWTRVDGRAAAAVRR